MKTRFITRPYDSVELCPADGLLLWIILLAHERFVPVSNPFPSGGRLSEIMERFYAFTGAPPIALRERLSPSQGGSVLSTETGKQSLFTVSQINGTVSAKAVIRDTIGMLTVIEYARSGNRASIFSDLNPSDAVFELPNSTFEEIVKLLSAVLELDEKSGIQVFGADIIRGMENEVKYRG